MTRPGKNIAVLGSTGSIGRNALEVIANSGGELCAKPFRPITMSICCASRPFDSAPDGSCSRTPRRPGGSIGRTLPEGVELLVGAEGIARAVGDAEIDMVLSAIVGSAGLQGTWAALEAGKSVALANKESLVMAGPLVMRLAEEKQAQILPVDSEHSAVFQAMQSGRRARSDASFLPPAGGHFVPARSSSWPKCRSPRPWPTPLGIWGRKLPSIRPPS